MNTISIDEMKAAVEKLAEKTNRTQHIALTFAAKFYAHRGHVTTEWSGYIEGSGHTPDQESMEEVLDALKFDKESILREADELEAQAANLRKLAVQS
jgi:predicted transcriptional regulator